MKMKSGRRGLGIRVPSGVAARLLTSSLLAGVVLLGFGSASAQTPQFSAEYTVKVASTADHLFHVTADFKNISQAALDLSLPAWTPGWYTIENYAKNILRFRVTDEAGKALPLSMTRKQTWRVDTSGLKEVKAEFDYDAEIFSLNQAKISETFAFFTGTEVFLMPEGHRQTPSTVKLEVPAGWKIITALDSTSDPAVFTAPDYDTLVDSPTLAGTFDLTRFEVEGIPHYLAVVPAGSFSKDKTEKFTAMLGAIAQADSRMFGGLPYKKYVYFYFFARPESNAGGALEHLSSHVTFAPTGEFATPDLLAGTAAHEFFHLWNVKRIRPAEMWPYDYSREDETPLLWVSEGFTNYYGNLSRYRAGLITRDQFLETAADAAGGVESNPARAYISPADSSVSTWLGYDSPVAFAISYYTQGQNLGALLDLSIRHDSAGAHGLDDVMVALYNDFYKKGRGFTTEDMISIVNRLTGKDYHEFYRRYVNGVEVPDYDAVFGFAGYQLKKSTVRVPNLDVRVRMSPDGPTIERVAPGSAAAQAGLVPGDVLVSIDGMEVGRRFYLLQQHLAEKMGQTIPIVVKRNGQAKTLQMKIEGHEESEYKLVEAPKPTPEQLAIRSGWLK
jgi:predicted metalloprotease with PDZ domain